MKSQFVIGIDLGTSNCAMAYVEPALGEKAPVVDVPVPQLTAPGELAKKPLFPSVVYLPFDGEFPPASLALPWEAQPSTITGALARVQGGRVPGRVITSAKSWLIHPQVDRQAAILPWGATSDVPRMSPVAAQAVLLKHLAHAWNAQHAEAPFAAQDVVITIPASFDEGARALTLQAARDAGYDVQRVTLLEEPQAAFYDFTARHRKTLAKALTGKRLILVVDVGGGTTDFSLVQVAMLPEGPALQRIAVGEHLLLGGDNMDAALARLVESRAFPDGRRFSQAQWTQAIAGARTAKEALLSSKSGPKQVISIAGSGSKLVGGTISIELSREDVETTVTQGFFPAVTQSDFAAHSKRAGVVELGLPYATDAAIPRHLVAFLAAHADAGRKALGDSPHLPALPRPDAILLNGGVFNSAVLTKALLRTVSALWPDEPEIPLLPHDSLDLAVARGAAYSGLARRALGKKITGGAPRAYFAVVELADNGSPLSRGRRGVCLIPRGQEEGSSVTLERDFVLALGKPVQFQLVSTTADRLEKAGDVIGLEGDDFKDLPPIHTILAGAKGQSVTARLTATLTEVGTLALAAVSGEQRFRLEFELRGSVHARENLVVTESMPAKFGEAVTEVERVFGTKPLPVEPKDVKQLFRTLERVLGPRETWRLPVMRELWTALFAGVSKRRRSSDHEKIMWQLLGYTLRPGTGYPLDSWRCEQTFTLFKDLVTHHGEHSIWAEFWVLWRRIAPGLNEKSQSELWGYLKPHLLRRVPQYGTVSSAKGKGINPEGLEEMVRTAAALELIAPSEKEELGAAIVSRFSAPETAGGPWAWALGRLGARVPLHGAAHRVVSADTAEKWATVLLACDFKRHDQAPFALVQLARKTGDRARDVNVDTQAQVLSLLEKNSAPETWKQLVANVVQMSASDEARALGDTLPLGLSLA